MATIKGALILTIVATAIIAGAAQRRESVGLSADFPVPAWPTNGVIPMELKGHYVFVDPPKNEYVVAYPDNLGSPNFEKEGPAELQIHRYPLQRDVDPKVSVAVTPSTGGKNKYAYTIFNSPSAKQSLDQWILVLPDAADMSGIKRPAGWFGVIQKGRKFTVAKPDWIKSGTAAVFSFEKQQDQILPGSIKGGFELESDLKPGFTVGFFRQAESVDAAVQTSGNIPVRVVKNATPPPPPEGAGGRGGGGGFGGAAMPPGATVAWQPIKEDVEKLLRWEYNSRTVLVLAPKFDRTATDKTIAEDFVQGITALGQTAALPSGSQFAKSTIDDLDAYIKAGGSGPLKLSVQPKTEGEVELFNAMKISLHLN